MCVTATGLRRANFSVLRRMAAIRWKRALREPIGWCFLAGARNPKNGATASGSAMTLFQKITDGLIDKRRVCFSKTATGKMAPI